MIYFGKTDKGIVRDNNQDSFFAGYLETDFPTEDIFLAVVCDGMGGAAGGKTASTLAVDTFKKELVTGLNTVISDNLPKDACESALAYASRCANSAVYKAAEKNPELRGMGTTLVALLVFRNMAYAVNIGDSRIYVLTEDSMEQLTHDHSYVQTLVDEGKITKEQAKDHPNKNVIMRAVGTDTEVTPDFFKLLPHKKSFLLCSDGLSNYASEESIESTLRAAESPEKAVAGLIDLANAGGGYDNITAVLVIM